MNRFFRVTDINGDGLADFVNWELGTGLVSVALSTGSGFSPIPTYQFGGGGTAADRFFRTADLNGDGRTDLIKWELGSGIASAALSSGSGFTPWANYYFGSGGSTDSRFFSVSDATGDGRADLIKWELGSGIVTVAVSTTAGFSEGPTYDFGAGSSAMDRFFRVADVNGDGRADIVKWELGSGIATVAFSTAGGFAPGPTIYLGSGGTTENRFLRTSDINADGRADLVTWDLSSGQAVVVFSTPNGFAPGPIGYFGEGGSVQNRFFQVIDIRGEGYPSLVKWELAGGVAGTLDYRPQTNTLVPGPATYFGTGGTFLDRFFNPSEDDRHWMTPEPTTNDDWWKRTVGRFLEELRKETEELGRDLNDVFLEVNANYYGTALANWIWASRRSALANSLPIPGHIRRELAGYYPDSLLDKVTFKVGETGAFNAAGVTIGVNSDVSAVTLADVIVFRNQTDAQNNVLLWVHELHHVQQFDEWGIWGFAVRYLRSWNSVEDDAEARERDYLNWALPAAPAGLTATAVSPTQISLNWTDAANNENGYQVERSTDGVHYVPIWTPPENTTSFFDTGLSPGHWYSYRVMANNNYGISPFSNVASAVTPDYTDADGDGAPDWTDNCTQLPNPGQVDSDGDGYGNRCDGDLNNNGFTNSQDAVLFRMQLAQPRPGQDYRPADLNADGYVNAQDTVIFRKLLGTAPGPSAQRP